MTEVVYVSQETAAARTIAPAKAALKDAETVEKAVGRRIVTLMKRVTRKTTTTPKLNRVKGAYRPLTLSHRSISRIKFVRTCSPISCGTEACGS